MKKMVGDTANAVERKLRHAKSVLMNFVLNANLRSVLAVIAMIIALNVPIDAKVAMNIHAPIAPHHAKSVLMNFVKDVRGLVPTVRLFFVKSILPIRVI